MKVDDREAYALDVHSVPALVRERAFVPGGTLSAQHLLGRGLGVASYCLIIPELRADFQISLVFRQEGDERP